MPPTLMTCGTMIWDIWSLAGRTVLKRDVQPRQSLLMLFRKLFPTRHVIRPETRRCEALNKGGMWVGSGVR